MSAQGNLNPQQFHGTNKLLGAGAHIKPAAEAGTDSLYTNLGQEEEIESHSYATTDLGAAAHYAKVRKARTGEGAPHVYRVTPLGDTEPDPAAPDSVRSQGHLRVDSEVSRGTWGSAHSQYLKSISWDEGDF